MPELTESDLQALRKTHDTVIQLKTVLIGTNGDTGLVGEVKQQNKSIETLFSKQNKLNQRFWLLVGILVGSGVIGTTVLQIL